MGKAWILFDGRAEGGDTDDASVLEFAGTTRKDLTSALEFWTDADGVLVEYDDDGNGNLTNEQVIGHLREGKESLMGRCSLGKPE